MDDISDIIDGITKGSVSGMFGHGAEYWKSSNEMLPAETVAHMFEAVFESGKKRTLKDCSPSLINISKVNLKLPWSE